MILFNVRLIDEADSTCGHAAMREPARLYVGEAGRHRVALRKELQL
jgi:hypothetical protein